MALDHTLNYTSPAHHNFNRSFVTHFIFTTFLLLFTIPVQVQVVTICDRLHFYRWFSVWFKKMYRILQAIWGLYQLAQECHRLQKPVHQLQKSALRPSQQLVQTSPLLDECVFASITRPILICQTEESALLTSLTSQEIPAPQQNWASAESELLMPQEPSTSTTEQYSVSETPVHQVEPVLGMTPTENWWLQDRNRPQDITDIIGTAAYEEYVQTPIQTLNSIYINQPKHFLPLAEEAKWLAEEICKEKQAKQWAGIPHEKLLNQSFLDQLNSLQILEQLAPLQLVKEHLPSDIIDILERLRNVATRR